MPNPLINQGVFNRVRGSIKFDDFPGLNVTASWLTQEGIDISFQGDAGVLLPTMTGGASSPQPYQMVNFRVHLVRSQVLAQLFKNQIEKDTFLGKAKVFTDTSTLGDFTIRQATIRSMEDFTPNGQAPGVVVSIFGIYDVNAHMWDAV